MTALAGSWRFDGPDTAGRDCARMLAAQTIYGGVAAQWDDGDLALGRSLKRLLPEDIHDLGPQVAPSGNVLAADLRLDNREALARDLAIAGQSGLCDAAILLAALERWGEDALDRILGDYAFAYWRRGERTLWLGRDPLGMRPLHYHRSRGLFAFSSMPKGLHALAEVPRAPDEEAILPYLALLPQSDTRSFFKGIERVSPGHVLTVTREGQSMRRYWRPGRARLRLKASEYVEGLRHHLDEAVRVRLRGESHVAAHLSGGLDSAAVAATAAQLLAPGGGRVTAFTAVPREGYDLPAPGSAFADEGPNAALTAAMYPNIEHVLVRAGPRSPIENLDRNFQLFELPVLNLCNTVWLEAINDEAAARKLKVLVAGALGNANFSYDGMAAFAELFRAGRWLTWLGLFGGAWRKRRIGRTNMLAATFAPWMSDGLWRRYAEWSGSGQGDLGDHSLLSRDRIEAMRRLGEERGHDVQYRPPKSGYDARMGMLVRMDGGNYVKGLLAGWNIDFRDPTCDRRLIEYCLSIPTEAFIAGGVPRVLARKVLADRLPQPVLDETRRGYQGADWHEGASAARGRMLEELEALAENEPAVRVMDLGRMRRLVEDWPSSGWHAKAVLLPYRAALLRGLSVGHFIRRASGSNR